MTTQHKTWRFSTVNWRLKASCTVAVMLYAATVAGEELLYLASCLVRKAGRVAKNIVMCPVAVALLVVVVCTATALEWRLSWSK